MEESGSLDFWQRPTDLPQSAALPYLNEDISIIKRTPVNDRVSVEMRADFLNIFNRIVFGLGRAGTSMVRY